MDKSDRGLRAPRPLRIHPELSDSPKVRAVSCRPKVAAGAVSLSYTLKKEKQKRKGKKGPSLEGLYGLLPATLSTGGILVVFLFFLTVHCGFLIFCNEQM